VPVTVTTSPAEDATSYVSLAEFQAWADQRLKDISGKSDDQLGAALNAATEYMDIRFIFVGYREEVAQALEWPRRLAYDARGSRVVGVPQAVKDACCGYAFLALSTELMPSPTRDSSGLVVKSKDEKVGPISESVDYDHLAGYNMPVYPAIDRLLYRHKLVVRQGGISSGTVNRG
jgi:hypothetical protein